MANFICTKIYFLCLAILCIRGENSFHSESKAEKTLPFDSVLLQKLLKNTLPFPGSESFDFIIGDNLPFYKEIEHGFDSIFQQNLPSLKNDQRGKGLHFPKIDFVFGENRPLNKKDKSEQALDFPKIDSAFGDILPQHESYKSDKDAESDLEEKENGTYNYVYFVQVKPNLSVRSIIVANVSCNSGYRKDKRGKCRKML